MYCKVIVVVLDKDSVLNWWCLWCDMQQHNNNLRR